MGIYEDQLNDYSSAGPGGKRRARIKPKGISHKIARPKPGYQSPRTEEAAQEKPKVKASDVKNRIIKETLLNDSFNEVHAALQRDGYPGSAVLVSDIRSRTRDVLRVLLTEGIITQSDLDEYRRQMRRQKPDR